MHASRSLDAKFVRSFVRCFPLGSNDAGDLFCQIKSRCPLSGAGPDKEQRTMRFGSTAKVLAECKLKDYRISECSDR